MGSENEPAKLLLPYLQRADELQKHEPLVAYYCRLYAMERGLKIPQHERTKTTNALLVSLMKQLEKDKKSIKLTPEDNLHVEGFALNVFGKADKQDRAGRADLNTAKTFYAASIFFEILNQFGALQPDLEEKQKYAAWKAADIRKALKEGRKPTAGPPAGDEDLSIPSDIASNRHDLETTETSITSPGPESDLSHNYNDAAHYQPTPSIPPAPKFHGTVDNQHSTNIAPSMQFQDGVNNSQQSANISRSSPAYSTASYPSQDYHPPPPASSECPYSQTYHQQYSQEHSSHLATNNYLSHETPSSFSYPHFQSYPSFSESSLPSVPVNYTYYQGSDASYPSQSAPLTTNYTSSAEHNSRSRNEAVSEPNSASQTYQYDSNYQPSPEKIAEAHKSARFAVGALAFDDVSVAVDYLRKSLELLTNPSAGQ